MLKNNELYNIVGGGAIKYGIFALGAGIITFIIGLIDGYQNPIKCNK